ncbi:hypothetical protein ACQXY3_10225 [Corynebacterium diphtheriae]|nr:hypothetical protein [Corynebacterium diphtheriae]APM36589.1 hypothetical protein BS112_08975 [Corynebacterium diphtheriae]AWR14894.1 hypothetical protein B11Q_00176 [Corynebacterium diphtheriae]MBG9313430.1 hypothetical protein [Corynebacterium diphtheriae bv. mitis]ODS19417.1 hypothetical protein BGK43_10960 [Corynebacterium diphtheriae]ODS20953.1 hypothetical protein BGK38_10540 [Corynebacterium diphtheriae]
MAIFLKIPIVEIWPDLDGSRESYAERLVGRAEAIIMQRFPTLEKRTRDGAISISVVAGVVEDMVTRALDKTARGGMDKLAYPDVQMEWSADGGLGSGNLLWLTTDEIVLLSPPQPGGAFSIRKTPMPTFSEGSNRW